MIQPSRWVCVRHTETSVVHFLPGKTLKKCLFVADERPPEDQMILAKPSEPMSSSGSPTGVTWAAKLVEFPMGIIHGLPNFRAGMGFVRTLYLQEPPVLHLRWNVSCG